MKRTIFVVISCLLLLGLVLAGCDGEAEGEQVGVWPKAEYGLDPGNTLSRIIVGLNWTDIEYTGTEHFIIPEEWVDVWEEWKAG